jgi:hypothetical protein
MAWCALCVLHRPTLCTCTATLCESAALLFTFQLACLHQSNFDVDTRIPVCTQSLDTTDNRYVYWSPLATQLYRVSRFTHYELGGTTLSRGDLASEVVLWQDTDG